MANSELFPFRMFLDYFQSNYLNLYNFQDWNIINKPSQIVITSNATENDNIVLKRDMISLSQPSLQMFEMTIHIIENNYSLIYQQSTNTPHKGVHYTESQFKKKKKKKKDPFSL